MYTIYDQQDEIIETYEDRFTATDRLQSLTAAHDAATYTLVNRDGMIIGAAHDRSVVYYPKLIKRRNYSGNTASGGQIKDHRRIKAEHKGPWVVATDRFMSSWGADCPTTSFVAYPIHDYNDEVRMLNYCHGRSDFVRVRVNSYLPRLKVGEHVSIYDCKEED